MLKGTHHYWKYVYSFLGPKPNGSNSFQLEQNTGDLHRLLVFRQTGLSSDFLLAHTKPNTAESPATPLFLARQKPHIRRHPKQISQTSSQKGSQEAKHRVPPPPQIRRGVGQVFEDAAGDARMSVERPGALRPRGTLQLTWNLMGGGVPTVGEHRIPEWPVSCDFRESAPGTCSWGMQLLCICGNVPEILLRGSLLGIQPGRVGYLEGDWLQEHRLNHCAPFGAWCV